MIVVGLLIIFVSVWSKSLVSSAFCYSKLYKVN